MATDPDRRTEATPRDLIGPTIGVFAPALLTSITLEQNADGRDEIHIHPAGQGYWVARMLAALGAHPVLCCAASGEMAEVAAHLIESGIELRRVTTGGPSGAYVDDRRSGERHRVAEQRAAILGRHELDDLLCTTVAQGVQTGWMIVTGTNLHGTLPPETFRSLTTNLHELGVHVVVDLSGDELRHALGGHVDVIKVGHDELAEAGYSAADSTDALAAGADRLHRDTGADVYVTRADAGVLAATSAGGFLAEGPRLDTADHRGAGDSFTAAVTLARVLGLGPVDQLRLASAAAATNVLRHGLGSATLDAVQAVSKLVEVTER